MVIVAQWQSTGGHNQLSWVQFPAITSFVISLCMIMLFEMTTCGLVITMIIHEAINAYLSKVLYIEFSM